MIVHVCYTLENLILVEQGLANIFYKVPDKKYFQLRGPSSLFYSYSTLPLWSKDSHKQSTNGHDSVSVKFYLQKQVAGWIWPTGHSLPTSVVENQITFPLTSFLTNSTNLLKGINYITSGRNPVLLSCY